jgi:hypothetical protein
MQHNFIDTVAVKKEGWYSGDEEKSHRPHFIKERKMVRFHYFGSIYSIDP